MKPYAKLLPFLLLAAAAVGCPSAKSPEGSGSGANGATSASSVSTPASSSAASVDGDAMVPLAVLGPASPSSAASASASASTSAVAAAPALVSPAIGTAAPDFTLKDLDGKAIHLADYKGKIVVLEWFNPSCPFIKIAHEKRDFSKLAAKYAAKGIVFLAINSGAPGKQGNALEENKAAKKAFSIAYPILRDESGEVGKKYGASNTPHLFVIAKDGTLAYTGGLDDTRGGEIDKGDKVVPWLANALDAVLAGKKADPAQTKPWGCHVKYAD
jgi:peroxiredoxin